MILSLPESLMRIKKYFYISFFLFFFVTGNSFGTEEREKKRQLFRQAEISLRSQRLDEYNNYKNRLSDYELLPYLEYSEYQQNSPSREELEKFIDDYPLFPSLNSIKEQLLTIYYENQNWEGILRRTNKNGESLFALAGGFSPQARLLLAKDSSGEDLVVRQRLR